jgi:hypothetical protein
MKVSYIIAALIFVLGISLVSFGMTDTAEVTLLGVTFHPRIAKGLGVIATIFGLITFLAAWGSSQTPGHAGRRG